MVKGWKIRRILNGCKEIVDFKKDLKDIDFRLFNFVGTRDARIQLLKQRKSKMIELSKLIPKLYKNG